MEGGVVAKGKIVDSVNEREGNDESFYRRKPPLKLSTVRYRSLHVRK